MSINWGRLARKAAFSIGGTLIGGGLGGPLSDLIENGLDLSEQTGDILEAGLSTATAISGALIGETIEGAIWKEEPPDNPKSGTAWYKGSTKELFVWSGDKWVKVRT